MKDISTTIHYYNSNASAFIQGTITADMSSAQNRFLELLPNNGIILDFGCGSGRDTKDFLSKGYRVEACDGSEELCAKASEYTGISVKHMYFRELNDINRYDGIWACASILHLPKYELLDVLQKMIIALVPGGIIYTSFKYGDFEGERNGRYFTDFTIESFREYIKDITTVEIQDYWITEDVRPDREEKWLNLLIRKVGE